MPIHPETLALLPIPPQTPAPPPPPPYEPGYFGGPTNVRERLPKAGSAPLFPRGRLPEMRELAAQLGPLELYNTGKLPELPKLPFIPPMQLMQGLTVQAHPPGVPPPPPPLPIDAPITQAEMPPPMKADQLALRKLEPFKGDQGLSFNAKPRPPPKRQVVFRPTPPAGPPPAHAYILARKGSAPGTDIDVPPPPPLPFAAPSPPLEPPPNRVNPAHVVEAYQEHLRTKAKNTIRCEVKEAPPVPDCVVVTSQVFLNIIVASFIAVLTFYIYAFGSFFRPAAFWATHAASFYGTLANLGLFETVKCLVVAGVALVRHESERRQLEEDARRERMIMKSQMVVSGAETKLKKLWGKMKGTSHGVSPGGIQ